MKRTLKVLCAATLIAAQGIAAPAFAAGPVVDPAGFTETSSVRGTIDTNGFGGCFWLLSLFGACR